MSKTYKVTDPNQMNPTFVKGFNNNRDLEGIMSLYESNATFFDGENAIVGREAIRKVLAPLMNAPGIMETKVNFCGVNGDIAVLRADYQLHHEGKLVFAGSALEVARRQPGGTWLYDIDHPAGASLPSAWGDKTN